MRRLLLVAFLSACGDPADTPPTQIDAAPLPSDLEVSPRTLSASAVIGSTANNLEVTVTNTGAGTSTQIEAAISGTTDFTIATNTCGELSSRRSCRLVLAFTPSTVGEIEGTLTVSAASGGAATTALHGTGRPVDDLRSERSTPTSELGYAAVGHASTRTITFTISTVGAVPTGPLTATFADQNGFVKRADTCTGISLAPTETCEVVVGFEPVVVGHRETSLIVSGNPGGVIGNPVQGIGVATDNIVEGTPLQTMFPDTAVNATSEPLTITLTNTGSVPTEALALSLDVEPDQFAFSSNSCEGTVLPGGGTCTFAVAFTPKSAGMKIALVSVAGAGNPAAVTVFGTGL